MGPISDEAWHRRFKLAVLHLLNSRLSSACALPCWQMTHATDLCFEESRHDMPRQSLMFSCVGPATNVASSCLRTSLLILTAMCICQAVHRFAPFSSFNRLCTLSFHAECVAHLSCQVCQCSTAQVACRRYLPHQTKLILSTISHSMRSGSSCQIWQVRCILSASRALLSHILA